MRIKSPLTQIKNVSLKTKAFLIVLLAIAFPALGMVQAAQTVHMEGHVKSLNSTRGETEYKDSSSAKVDEVVQVQLWHHNREMPDKEKAHNTRVKFSIPNTQGKTHVITGTSSSDNGQTITDSTVVNTTLDRNRLEYIPGSAKFRYNKGAKDGKKECQTGMNFPPAHCYATVGISDEVVKGGVNLDKVRGGPLHGCNAFHETVIVQVRIKADVVTVNKYVRHVGQTEWKTSTNAKPGDDLEYMIRFKNAGNTRLDDVVVGDNLPKYNAYIPGSTKLKNTNYPNGTNIASDNITKGGINVGNYMPGSVAYVLIRVKLDPITAYEKCGGNYDLRNVGIVRPKGMNEHYNTAQVLVNVPCEEKPEEKNPVYSCDLLIADRVGNRTVNYRVNASAGGGAKIKNYVFDFGDGETFTTDKNTASHTYAKDGQYVTRVKVNVAVDSETRIAESDKCVAVINFTTPPKEVPPQKPGAPTQLPEAGPADTAAIVLLVTATSAGAYYMVARRGQL